MAIAGYCAHKRRSATPRRFCAGSMDRRTCDACCCPGRSGACWPSAKRPRPRDTRMQQHHHKTQVMPTSETYFNATQGENDEQGRQQGNTKKARGPRSSLRQAHQPQQGAHHPSVQRQ
ncbi:hypothetical protein ACCAA_670039 [Candidatus Accumulibacter aalborgensis]|uniref:Uncharacterized protein n=1 Tax=Candidatus Accumulibacter aalborgensis TaxID=1860102 RepID=A0A1A8XWV7_9PROT|nr:hypothetical protein ACCAA_670039 [Candidatus Accumulibacter aalborgensis]